MRGRREGLPQRLVIDSIIPAPHVHTIPTINTALVNTSWAGVSQIPSGSASSRAKTTARSTHLCRASPLSGEERATRSDDEQPDEARARHPWRQSRA